MKRIVLAIVIFAMSISTACADYYKINVTRVSSNIYKIEGTSPTIYIDKILLCVRIFYECNSKIR